MEALIKTGASLYLGYKALNWTLLRVFFGKHSKSLKGPVVTDLIGQGRVLTVLK